MTFAPGAHAQNVRTIYLVRHADKVSDETMLCSAMQDTVARMLAKNSWRNAHIHRYLPPIYNARNRQPHL